jgi:hypothetical protein
MFRYVVDPPFASDRPPTLSKCQSVIVGRPRPSSGMDCFSPDAFAGWVRLLALAEPTMFTSLLALCLFFLMTICFVRYAAKRRKIISKQF